MLVNGKWMADWQPVQAKDDHGRFVRQMSSFRNWITPDGSPGPTGTAGFLAEAGRYRLYVALICPWASRTLIARKLKGLEDLITVMCQDQSVRLPGSRRFALRRKAEELGIDVSDAVLAAIQKFLKEKEA